MKKFKSSDYVSSEMSGPISMTIDYFVVGPATHAVEAVNAIYDNNSLNDDEVKDALTQVEGRCKQLLNELNRQQGT